VIWSGAMHKFVFLALLFLVCGYAWRKGGAPERAVALILLVGTFLTALAASLPAVSYDTVEIGILLVDIVAFLALFGVALFAERFWPMCIAGLQLVGLAGHLAMSTQPGLLPWAYAFILSIWSYPMLALLALGTWRHVHRQRRDGAEPDWSWKGEAIRG
jgi:hypothetical protein